VTTLSVLLVVAACVMTGRWWMRRYDALGRPRPFPRVGVGLLVVLALVVAVPTYLRHREEDRLSAAATQLVGASARVHCQTIGQEMVDLGSELGYVKWGMDGVPEHRTLIKHGPCRALHGYLDSSKQRPNDGQVVAVHVLTHESMHMHGLTGEAQAECAAVQRDAETARLLGADEASARTLARRYWLEIYPRMPDDYRSAQCGPGGSLDEHLPDAPWSYDALSRPAT
jgi:hypothetical protein